MTTVENVLLQRDGPVAILTLNRPAVKNAVDLATMEDLATHVATLRGDAQVRAVIFSAQGGEAFCSGGDLKAFQALTRWEDAYAMSTRMQRALHALETLPVPVLGVLNGYAMGGGCEAFLATDVRIVEDHAYLSFKQLQMGVSLGWGGAARLARDVGGRNALKLVLMGEKLGPQQARDLGLADEVVARGTGLDRARVLALRFAQLPPLAVAALKRMTRQEDHARVHQEASVFASTWASRDHQEAVAAFFEKRDPVWEGR